MEHVRKGRVWTFKEREPYRRRDGTWTAIGVWQSGCAKCGAPVTAKVPADMPPAQSNAFDALHCPAHRLTRTEVTARWWDSIRRKNAR